MHYRPPVGFWVFFLGSSFSGFLSISVAVDFTFCFMLSLSVYIWLCLSLPLLYCVLIFSSGSSLSWLLSCFVWMLVGVYKSV